MNGTLNKLLVSFGLSLCILKSAKAQTPAALDVKRETRRAIQNEELLLFIQHIYNLNGSTLSGGGASWLIAPTN